MTFVGQPLYASRPTLWTTNYPFLSFNIIGLLGGVKGSMVLVGRIVCFIALIATYVVDVPYSQDSTLCRSRFSVKLRTLACSMSLGVWCGRLSTTIKALIWFIISMPTPIVSGQ
jgi:hypothetical protein